jgi:hypothetical protein
MKKCCICDEECLEYRHCKICNDRICKACYQIDDSVPVEWSEARSYKCFTCKKLLCTKCVAFCFRCANGGSVVPSFCPNCKCAHLSTI